VRVGHRGVSGRWEGDDHERGTAMRHDDERGHGNERGTTRRAPLMGMSHRHARGGIMESHRRDPCPEWGHGNIASACPMPGPGITHGCVQCPNRDHADARCIVVPLSWEYLIVAHGNVAHGHIASACPRPGPGSWNRIDGRDAGNGNHMQDASCPGVLSSSHAPDKSGGRGGS
jgi:hypothetical protein